VRTDDVRVLLALCSALLLVPAAAGDGLPVLGVDVGSTGITAPGGTVRYVTAPVGGSTLVEAIRRDGGQIVRLQSWPGSWTIPAVAYDRTPGGLSADRRTLVLIEPRTSFPRRRTRLLVLDAQHLGSAGVVVLRGDFSFDAISPDGSRLYLIQYTSRTDPTRYLVRAYDVRTHGLEARPIADPRNPAERMRGNPLSRVASANGRWAYTLYDGGGSRPFVHALDTAAGTARCVDLGRIPAGINLWSLRLHLVHGGRELTVNAGARVLASFRASAV
jgi:hypothetical protein